MSAINENTIEEVEDNNVDIVKIEDTNEEPLPMEKPKRNRSVKQIEALKKAQETRKANIEAKKKISIKPSNNQSNRTNVKLNNYTEEYNPELDLALNEVMVKKKKAKRKPRIVVEEDSSDSDQEIVISRRRKSRQSIKQKEQMEGYINDKVIEKEKAEPVDIPNDTPQPEPIFEPTPQYTRQQILRAYGF
tara:strand:- start:551 stop:1120 length:570 start_codon:yes stop_codon:yes gene_type:complete